MISLKIIDIVNQRRKLFVLAYGEAIVDVRNAIYESGIQGSSFYDPKKAYDR